MAIEIQTTHEETQQFFISPQSNSPTSGIFIRPADRLWPKQVLSDSSGFMIVYLDLDYYIRAVIQ
jgi:hypothetical protein